MTLNTALKDSILFDLEENKSIEDASSVIRSGLVKFFSAMKEEQSYTQDYARLVDLTEESISKYTSSQYKFTNCLEPNEIEQIKKALKKYTNDNEKVNAFKKEILEDLTAFQQNILTSHKERIIEVAKEKETCEKQMRICESEKNRLIMDRLSKIVWPYDETTKEYDAKIAQLQAKVQQYSNKIETLKTMRPSANERDILLFKLQLKEKFSNKK